MSRVDAIGRQAPGAILLLGLATALLPVETGFLSSRALSRPAAAFPDAPGHRTAPLDDQEPGLDTASLARGPYATMSTLHERTIFQVDVLRLELRFGPETAARLRTLASGRSYTAALADSLARIALRSWNVLVRVRFERDIGLGRFLEGVGRDLERARRAGIVDGRAYRAVTDSLRHWYRFLRGRGVRDGDRMLYRITGDTLRTLYLGAGGRLLLDQTTARPGRAEAVLGGYFAPGSPYREELAESLFERSPGGRRP